MKKRILSTTLVLMLLSSCSHTSEYIADRTPQSSDLGDWYGRFGACLVSPDNHDYEKKWATYHDLIQRKVRLNISHYAEMPVSKDIREFVSNLALISPIVIAWDAIKKSSWAMNMDADKNFVELTSSAAFIYALRDPNFVARNQDPNFIQDYNSDPDFRKNFDIILASIRDSNTRGALTYFHQKHLVFVDPNGLASALKLARFFQLPDSAEDLGFVPFMKDLPLPPKALAASDNFTTAYWDLLESSIADFLEHHETSDENLNHLASPDETTPYDDYVVKSHADDEQTEFTKTVFGKNYKIGVHEIIAIDGVARTLWGEGRGCDMTIGMHGFAAIGLVMANRTMAVQNTINEKASVRQQNKAIEEEDVDIFMNSNAKDSLKGFIPERSLGQADFGIKGSIELAASQVVSKPSQFSCWNGYNKHEERLSAIANLPSGMPDFTYTFKIPKDNNNQEALVNVLCPQMTANVRPGNGQMGWNEEMPSNSNADWRAAVDIATLVVLDPARFKEIYHFSPRPSSAPLFYTHQGARIPGSPPRLSLEGMTFTDPETGQTSALPLFKSGGGVCNTLRIFSARSRTVYGVSP